MKTVIDLLVTARKIYTLDPEARVVEAMAVDKGRILALGPRSVLEGRYEARRTRDLGHTFVYPGFIDPHCHFLGFGYMLQRADLFDTSSWEEVVARLVTHQARHPAYWVQGRGWNQNDWNPREFPDCSLLDKAFPDNPVLIIRVDGHAALVNTKALELSGINASTKVEGGVVALGNGRPTGLLLDNAIDLVKAVIPALEESTRREALLAAQEKCFAVGLTSVSNAGTDLADALLMERMQDEGSLGIRIYAMLKPDEAGMGYLAGGPRSNSRLTLRSFKMYADGALGSRGAYLLEPYSDDAENRGIATLRREELSEVCHFAFTHGLQMNVHAIGDAAVRLVLDVYELFLEPGNDLRWRIEHAQIVHPDDLARFGRLKVIPSVQTSHATSDMPWMESRLGKARMGRAHNYRALLGQNGWLANGSDFPIEKIDPLRGFRSAVFRKDDKGRPEGGFMPEGALSREEALKAMTIWAAKANFEEESRGSLEPGKWADFTVLDKDLLRDNEAELWDAKVRTTAIAGEILHTLS
jgi:predicted amidohydrolase YtcJ